MSFNNYTTYPSTGDTVELSPRASSSTLFSQRPFGMDGAKGRVDMSIAKELLDKEALRIPKRRISFSQPTATQERQVPPKTEVVQVQGAAESPQRRARYDATSNTWTSSEDDESNYAVNEDRTPFVEEYNRLAKKYGFALIFPDEFVPFNLSKVTIFAKQGSWIMRRLLKRTTSNHVAKCSVEKSELKHKRSISDLTLRLKLKKDPLKDKNLEELVRLCGASALYLPSEYAAGTLAVPTCFRATAQYLIQHAASTRGIFRIPGAHSTVMALYNHYASEDEHGDIISGTVRCPTLPEHIRCDVHDVASAFKKFLAGLPGGILGKAWLFDAFIAVHNQLDATPEWTRTKHSRLRARLIALIIASTVPRYQRELICAVFGLLSMIGRAAETARREDEHGRPLPTSDLMGYVSLGVVFGPLLVGEMLEAHHLRPVGPSSTSHLAKRDSPRSLKGRNKKSSKSADDASKLMRENTEKIRIANKITEMLITHWRDIVKHMKNLGALRSIREYHSLAINPSRPALRPSVSESFIIRKPPQWDSNGTGIRRADYSVSPSPPPRHFKTPSLKAASNWEQSANHDTMSVRKQRSRSRPLSNQTLSGARSMSILAPTVEEKQQEEGLEKTAAIAVRVHHSRNQTSDEQIDNELPQSKRVYRPVRFGRSYRTDLPSCKHPQTVPLSFATLAIPCDQNTNSSTIQSSTARSKSPYANVATKLEKATDNLAGQFETAPDCATPYPGEPSGKDPNRREGDGVVTDGHEPTRRPFSADESPLRSCTPQMRRMEQTERHTQPETPSPQRMQLLRTTHFPKGIVPNRIRGITASESTEIPSAFHAPLMVPDGSPERAQGRLNRRDRTSDIFPRSIKDPLSRISAEEDMASLAALAEVIESQDKAISHLKIDISPSVVGDNSLHKNPISLSHSVKPTHLEQPKYCQEENCFKRRPSKEDGILHPASAALGPITPRKTIISSQPGGSVRKLAAKFDKVEIEASLLLTSTSPNHRHGTRSMFEQKGVSHYTSNTTSPGRYVQRLTRSAKSDKPLHSVRSPLPASQASTSHSNQPNSKDYAVNEMRNFETDGGRDSKSPPYPKFRHFTHILQCDAAATATERCRREATPAETIFRIQRNCHEITDATISKRRNLGKVLPRPYEPLVDQYLNFARPPSTTTTPIQDQCGSPFEIPDSETLLHITGAQVSSQFGLRRGASLLYSQVQHLQRQVRAKTDEAEQLKRQLIAKDSLNELGTLSEKLRQTKRDLISWKKRAEIAEKRVALLLDIEKKDEIRITSTEGSAKVVDLEDRSATLNVLSIANTPEKVLHGQSTQSIDTVRRTDLIDSARFSEFSESELDDVRDILRAFEDGVYELE